MKLRALALFALLLCTCAPEAEEVELRTDPEPVLLPGMAPVSGKFTIAGRVVDVRGRSWPKGRVTVRLYTGDDSDYQRQVRELGFDGRFRFGLDELPEQASIRLGLNNRSSWRWLAPGYPKNLKLSHEQLIGEEHLLLEIAECRRGRLRGVAVNARTGEPVSGLAFSVNPEGRYPEPKRFERFSIVTDEHGRFETPDSIMGGPVTVSSHPGHPRAVNQRTEMLMPEAGEDRKWILPFHVGPTLELKLTGAVPTQLDKLKAWVILGGRRGAQRSDLSQRG